MDDESGRQTVDDRLARMAGALRTHGLTILRTTVYRDDGGDGTGDLAWLWARADPQQYPDEDHDLAVHYSEMDGDWLASTPDNRTLRIPADDDAAAAETAISILTPAPNGEDEATASRSVPDWVIALLSGAATTVILPFVQTIATKTAEDAYASLRRLIKRRKPPPKLEGGNDTAENDPTARYVSITDPEFDVQLLVPEPIPPQAVRQLVIMDRSELRGRTLWWDEGRREWLWWNRK